MSNMPISKDRVREREREREREVRQGRTSDR